MLVPPTARRRARPAPILKSSTGDLSASGGLANGPVSRNCAARRPSVAPVAVGTSRAALARPVARCGPSLTPLAAPRAEPRRYANAGVVHRASRWPRAPFRTSAPA